MVNLRSVVVEVSKTFLSVIVWRVFDTMITYAQTGIVDLIPTTTDLVKALQAYIQADPAIFNLSSNIYPDTVEIRARADRLNTLAAKGILGSRIDMNDYTVNVDLLVRQGRETADGHIKRIASLLLGKVLEYERETK